MVIEVPKVKSPVASAAVDELNDAERSEDAARAHYRVD